MNNFAIFKKTIKDAISNFFKVIVFNLLKGPDVQAKLNSIILNSFDPEELKNKIVKEIAISFGASECFFLEFDSDTNNFKKITNSYSLQRTSSSLLGFDIESELKYLAIKLKYLQSLVIDDTELYIKNNNLINSAEEKFFYDFEIKSLLCIRLEFGESLSGILVLSYKGKNRLLNSIYLMLLKELATKISIALHLSKLYVSEKNKRVKEQLLRSIISIINNDYNLGNINNKVFQIIGKMYSAESVFINIEYEELKRFYYYNFSKFKSSELKDYEKSALLKIYQFANFDVVKNKLYYIENSHHFIIQNNLEKSPIEKYFIKNNIKAFLFLPISHENKSLGFLIIHFDRFNPLSGEDLDLIKTVIVQLAIAVKQTYLYEKEAVVAKRESLLRAITEKIRRSLDIEETLSFICEEVVKVFNVQRSALSIFPDPHNFNIFTIKKEYIISPEYKSFLSSPNSLQVTPMWGEFLIKNESLYAIDNIQEAKVPDVFKSTYKHLGVKSIIGVAIKKGDDIWGILVLSEYNQLREWSDEEKKLLKTIADQVYMAVNQAELYEQQKFTAERERISRNIIEILRSSIDKTIIKKLFVKNIGKFFDADRVFFSEYDPQTRMYLPVDEDSEYLSDKQVKSFIGYDWSEPKNQDHIQKLLEKREIRMPDWEEYSAQNQYLSADFKSLYDEYNVQSSYNFPVLYQDKIMGYFCVEFTQKVVKLSEEDLGRIRSICTQAGIALHHAGLYIQAKACNQSKEDLISKISEQIEIPTTKILDTSILLSKNEYERDVQLTYLDNIISSCHELLELTNNII